MSEFGFVLVDDVIGVQQGAISPDLLITLGDFLQGEKGDRGPQGIQGPPGTGSASAYVYSQGNASSTWSINHQLGRFPSVTVVDSAGTEVEGDVRFIDANNITVSFAHPFAGQAFLN